MTATTKPWYDTREGFEKALKGGLSALRELADERCEAGYKRKERLGWWLVNKHFVFDECGNTSVILENAPDYYSCGNKYPPQVMTKEEWQATGQQRPMSYTMGSIPPSVEVCPRCLSGWDLRNVANHKAVHDYKTETWTHYHKDCHKLKVQQESAKFFEELIRDSEINYTEMRAIPNGYSSDYASSWWIIETEKGPIKIGSRKRVFSISWENAPGLKDVDGETLFADQQVTKERYLIHAWSKEDAIKYLQKIVWGDVSDCPPCMSYCKVGHQHDGECEPMEGR